MPEFPSVLTSIPKQYQKRITRLDNHFKSKFPDVQLSIYIRVPGRVNLIGEHIDYCGYGVFPMALEQDIIVAVAVTDDGQLRLSNTSSLYADKSFQLDEISISRPPSWYDYFLCGIEGIRSTGVTLTGMVIVVDGTVPPSAGLSSSSALVCAAALAAAFTNNVEMSKHDLATLCAKSERHVGTEGGGMDQAIAFLANQGTAKMIDFNPLRAVDVKLPDGAVFVVANSLAESNKAAGNDYNCRVMECRLATQLLAKDHGLEWKSLRRLGDLQTALDLTLPEMIALVKKELHSEAYKKTEICKMLDVTEEELNTITLSSNTEHIREFKIQQRALHVFEEANRVHEFRSICENESGILALKKLGTLMIGSHESLRDQYECSHPQLDKLVELSENITYGARLTGAGWGGCIVALVPSNNVTEYLQLLNDSYYSGLPAFQGRAFNQVAFQTQPGNGACVFKVQG